jgi:hypothetical protein
LLICFFTFFLTPAKRGRLFLTEEKSKINISAFGETGQGVKMILLIELISER